MTVVAAPPEVRIPLVPWSLLLRVVFDDAFVCGGF